MNYTHLNLNLLLGQIDFVCPNYKFIDLFLLQWFSQNTAILRNGQQNSNKNYIVCCILRIRQIANKKKKNFMSKTSLIRLNNKLSVW